MKKTPKDRPTNWVGTYLKVTIWLIVTPILICVSNRPLSKQKASLCFEISLKLDKQFIISHKV